MCRKDHVNSSTMEIRETRGPFWQCLQMFLSIPRTQERQLDWKILTMTIVVGAIERSSETTESYNSGLRNSKCKVRLYPRISLLLCSPLDSCKYELNITKEHDVIPIRLSFLKQVTNRNITGYILFRWFMLTCIDFHYSSQTMQSYPWLLNQERVLLHWFHKILVNMSTVWSSCWMKTILIWVAWEIEIPSG